MRILLDEAWQRALQCPPLTRDAVLYLLGAVFAACTGVFALTADYREWGDLSVIPYLVAAVASVLVAVIARRRGLRAPIVRLVRVAFVVAVGLSAMTAPLLAELSWRAGSTRGAHAQQEVAVIERAGDRLAAGSDPYPRHPTTTGIAPVNDAHGIDANSFFPYLPGMAVFGLLNATSLPAQLGDARVLFVVVGLIAFAMALSLSRASPSRRILAWQFFVALPTGALPMVTGGDDIPVIALLLLGLTLAARRKLRWSGIVFAIACSLKLTAWPIAFFLLLAVRAEGGWREVGKFIAGLVLVVPVVLFGYLGAPSAFITNVIRFPLGLTSVRSPAASPLFGQFLVNAFPAERRLLTFALVAVGLVVVLLAYRWYRPTTVVGAIRMCAFSLVVATALAPATRFGYLIYPTLLYVWAYVLAGLPELTQARSLSAHRLARWRPEPEAAGP